MTETPARIRWQREDDNSLTGRTGTMTEPVFWIWPPESPGKAHILTSSLPGRNGPQDIYPNGFVADVKAKAEEWLEEFVTSLGAIFADALRSEVESMRGDKYQLAGDHEESGHDWQTERCYGAVEALDWMLATIDRMAANPAPAGEE